MVVNPHGGLKKGIGILDRVKPIFDEGGAELTILETEYAGHAREMAREKDFTGYDGFCAIGGDGTMHEVINGMLKRPDEQKIPIGLVTGGTGNSFMHDLDCLDPENAAKRILTGRLRPIDIAKVDANGETIYGFNIVGWGMPTDINFLAEKLLRPGEQRYNVESIIKELKGNPVLYIHLLPQETLRNPLGCLLFEKQIFQSWYSNQLQLYSRTDTPI